MNSDENTPTSDGTPKAESTTGQQPVRRAGFLGGAGASAAQASGNGTTPAVPAPGSATLPSQGASSAFRTTPARSAFRPTTGTEPSSSGSPFTPVSGASAAATAAGATGAVGAGAATSGGNAGASSSTGGSGLPSSIAPQRGTARPAGATATATTETPASASAVTGERPATDAAADAGAKSETKRKALVRMEAAASQPSSGPRKARVLLSRIDPLSSVKIGFLLSIAAGIMLVVAVHVLWQVLAQMGFFVLVQEWVSRLFTEGDQGQELNILQFVEYSKIMSATVLIAVVNVVLLTGLAAVWSLLYNFISRVVGGIYVTLTDD